MTDPEDGGERELAVHEKGGFFDEAALVTDADSVTNNSNNIHAIMKRTSPVRYCEATVQVLSRRAECLVLRCDRIRHVAGCPGISRAFSAAHTTRVRQKSEGNITARRTLGK